MVTKKGSTKFVNFMTPGTAVLVLGRGLISNIVKIHYSYLLPGIDQTNYVYSNDDQGRVYQNCIFNDPGAGVLMLGCSHLSHI